MKYSTRILAIAVLTAAALTTGEQKANADRVGGAVSGPGTVPAYQSLYFDVPFYAGVPANVSVIGNGSSNLDLYIYDGTGNVTAGAGFADRKIATMNVTQAGFFRIEVRNLGPSANTFVLTTN